MLDILLDALIDSAKTIPILLVVYIIIEIIENKMGDAAFEKIHNARKAGPAAAALLGCIPQCGFSVVGTTLYSRRIITLGTLIALYLSTSDEAIPILLSHPDNIGVVLQLILVKIVIAMLAGYLIDLFTRRWAAKNHRLATEPLPPEDADGHLHEAESAIGCCGHHIQDSDKEEPAVKRYLLHPLIHTAKVFLFIFLVSVALGAAIYYLGEENLNRFLLSGSIFQPLIVALVGLIPNCAASVAITQLYVAGGISFGAAVAGMCSSAGLGLVVLFKENHKIKENLGIMALLYCIGAAAGIVLQFLFP